MGKSIVRRMGMVAATVLAAMVCAFAGYSTAFAADAPDIDGNLSEWGSITKQASTDSDIDYWQIAKDADGNVYLSVSGTASNEYVSWDWKPAVQSTINGQTQTSQFGNMDKSWSPLHGTTKVVKKANGNTAGPMYLEAKIDVSSFKGSSDYSITFVGTTVKASDIPTFSASKADDTPATYNGITIDGKFNDWDAVSKTETSDPNSEHKNNLASEAMVFDGDYVYLYIEEGKGGDATGAGTHSNGQFSITTDLGNELLVQLRSNEVTAGGQSVSFKHVGRQWEIAVPKSMLPSYQKTLSFGLYQQDPTVKDVANLDTSDNGNAGTFSGITYDGDYSDWKAYPHSRIQYATSGTQEHVQDAEAALYSSDGILYSHVKTTMPAHLDEKGSEFLSAVTYDFGDGRLYYPNFAEVDSDGTIHWYSGGTKLSAGTHELYLFDTQGWNNSTNINSLTSGDRNYGKVTVTVNEDGSIDEMESEIDLSQIAKKFNCDAGDFRTIKAQFGRLGQEWVETAGTSTNPYLGTGIAAGSVVAAVGGYGVYRRRKNGAPAAGSAADGTISGNAAPRA